MATTDYEIAAQRDLANFSYDLKVEYNLTYGQTRQEYLYMYDMGEITLSTVFENLIVAAAKKLGIDIKKVSEDCRDFSNNADAKIGVLKKDGYKRRYVISNVANKVGTIYFIGWNWIAKKPEFHAIPWNVHRNVAQGIKICRNPVTGAVTSGKYNQCVKSTFEEMVLSYQS
jgi:hypothetical protein